MSKRCGITNQPAYGCSGRNNSVEAPPGLPIARSAPHPPAVRGVAGDVRHDEAHGRVVGGVALEVVLQTQAEAQVVRAERARTRIDGETVTARVAGRAVVRSGGGAA